MAAETEAPVAPDGPPPTEEAPAATAVRAPKPPAVDIGPIREITLHVRSLPRTWLGRRITRRAPQVVIVRWPDHAIGLRVPTVDETVPRLQACLDALRYD